ncbi:uncharacterized protein BYT42DRAFT_615718 [Radiomyces spectabilis]|uniref:uncharacterized protein n=1 Tax=Radiomyces spectabilis TaxID=64574 RepID=UPI00221F1D45|nr:uncharacterized protein BYT42DRAFT_615718 [Radiomyces spectabilis]KAI8374570.1 hypothetical protein BYT42DRAFT_615718 [Radiomyces spectabilis]
MSAYLKPSSLKRKQQFASRSTPTVHRIPPYQHPQMSYSAEYLATPSDRPSYDRIIDHTRARSWLGYDIQVYNDDLSSSSSGPATIDRRDLSQGLKLVSIAADEYDSGNEKVALDIYLTGLDKIVMALPNKTDSATKMALYQKLLSVEKRIGIHPMASACADKLGGSPSSENTEMEATKEPNPTMWVLPSNLKDKVSTMFAISSTVLSSSVPTPLPPLTSSSLEPLSAEGEPAELGKEDHMTRFKAFSQYFINLVVAWAVIIKQSPIPDMLYFVFGYFMHLLWWMNLQYHVVERMQEFGIHCMKLALKADEQYQLHELLSEAIYTCFAAILKAVVAFKETPGYQQRRAKSSWSSNATTSAPRPPRWRRLSYNMAAF